jgi:Tfp pilus assembly PilM family ATPase
MIFMILNPFASPSMLGIDIQSDWVKLVKVKKTRRGFQLENAIAKRLPDDIVIDGKIRRFDIMTRLLADLVQVLNAKTLPAAISLSANLVRMQSISLPRGLSDPDIHAEIARHIQRDLPGLNEPLSIDFTALASPESTQVLIFFAAIRQEYLNQCLACLHDAEVKIKVVDVDIFALHRVVCLNSDLSPQPNEINALLHLKPRTAFLIVFNHQEIVFHQQWDVSNAVGVVAKAKAHIQRYLTTIGRLSLDKLGCIGMKAEESVDTWVNKMVYPNFAASWTRMADIQDSLFISHPDEFLQAAGAAMREVPRW